MKPIPKIIYRVEWSGDVVTLMETKPESVPGRDGCLSVCEYSLSKLGQKYKIKSMGEFKVVFRGLCTAYTFLSPIAAPRDFEQYLEQLGGNPVEIDGVDREVIGLECYCLGTPIRREEAISLLVKNEETDG